MECTLLFSPFLLSLSSLSFCRGGATRSDARDVVLRELAKHVRVAHGGHGPLLHQLPPHRGPQAVVRHPRRPGRALREPGRQHVEVRCGEVTEEVSEEVVEAVEASPGTVNGGGRIGVSDVTLVLLLLLSVVVVVTSDCTGGVTYYDVYRMLK